MHIKKTHKQNTKTIAIKKMKVKKMDKLKKSEKKNVVIVTDTESTTKKKQNFRQHQQRQMFWFCLKVKKKSPVS